MACFEDAGYFCVDNLPPEMIGQLADLFAHEGSKVEQRRRRLRPARRRVLRADARGARRARRARRQAPPAVPRGVRAGADRPLQGDPPPPPARRGRPGQRRASARSASCSRRCASGRTSRSTRATCRRRGCARSWRTRCSPRASVGKLAVTFMSYGFKHGTPRDADLNFDVRFLPEPALRVRAAAADRAGRRGARVRRELGRPERVLRPAVPAARLPAAAVRDTRARRT